MAQTRTPETVKRLMPSSWTEVAIWAVIAVIFATHPAASARLVGKTVWGTGNWIGYQLVADCGTPPPFTWMDSKKCPTAGPVDDGAAGPAPTEAPTDSPSDAAQAEVYGFRLPTPDRIWAAATDLRDTGRQRLIEPNTPTTTSDGSRP